MAESSSSNNSPTPIPPSPPSPHNNNQHVASADTSSNPTPAPTQTVQANPLPNWTEADLIRIVKTALQELEEVRAVSRGAVPQSQQVKKSIWDNVVNLWAEMREYSAWIQQGPVFALGSLAQAVSLKLYPNTFNGKPWFAVELWGWSALYALVGAGITKACQRLSSSRDNPTDMENFVHESNAGRNAQVENTGTRTNERTST